MLTKLDDLAQRINLEHKECETALYSALNHAYNCGKLLLEAKNSVAYGQWGEWLKTHCFVSQRMAQNYMRLATHYTSETLPGESSIRDAIAALTEPKAQHVSHLESTQKNVWEHENFKKYCQNWGDYYRAYVYLMAAMGMTLETIANLTGKTENQVKRAVMPEFPNRFPRKGEQFLDDRNSIFGPNSDRFINFYETSQKGWVYKENLHSFSMAKIIAERDYPELIETITVQHKQAEITSQWNPMPDDFIDVSGFIQDLAISPDWEVLIKTQTNQEIGLIGPALFWMMVDDFRYANGTVEQSMVDTFENVPNYLLSNISLFGAISPF